MIQKRINTIALINFTQESWFVSTYSDKFFKVMRNFPYLPAVCTSKPGQTVDGGLTSGKSAAFMTQNLILCYLYHKFHVKSKNHELTCKVEKYILREYLKCDNCSN